MCAAAAGGNRTRDGAGARSPHFGDRRLPNPAAVQVCVAADGPPRAGPRGSGPGGRGYEEGGTMWAEITRLVPPRLAPHRRFLPVFPAPRPAASGLYAGEPEACRRDLRRFLPVLAHLGLLLAVFRQYNLEGRAFQGLVTLALAALPIHYALPYRLKKPAFVALSVAGLAWALGANVAAVVLPAAALLIGACFLPIRWGARAAIVAALGAAFGVARALAPAAGAMDAAWAVLGSMFMFRMILFLYELKHAEAPEDPVDALGYFFLLPNFCFLHFPVVDYRTFRRGYFAADVHALQRRGVMMMARGLFHLLLYRLVDHEFLIGAAEVHGPASLARHVVATYLLYLGVSGRFHMACGMLHLFGFHLPETHHNYLFATGFTDYWRRINIYWKDFMVRVVFNPVAFRLKHRPQWAKLTAATAAVFVATWSLHAYQSFWLKGTWGIGAPDALFWGILGVLVLVNIQLDARHPGARKPAGELASAVRVAKTAGTFVTIALLWSLWSSPSVGAWAAMMKKGLVG